MNEIFGPQQHALLESALKKMSDGEELAPDEKAVVMLAAMLGLMAAAVYAARGIKPVIDRIAALEPGAWFAPARRPVALRPLN